MSKLWKKIQADNNTQLTNAIFVCHPNGPKRCGGLRETWLSQIVETAEKFKYKTENLKALTDNEWTAFLDSVTTSD